MTEIIIALFTLGMIDTLDPYGISTLLLLLQIVRKDWHALIKVWTTYLTYWLLAVLVYYGIFVHLQRIFDQLQETFPSQIVLAQVIGGILFVILALVFFVRLIRNWSGVTGDISKVLFIKSVHPAFIVLYSISLVLANIPVLWPLYSFIAILLPWRMNLPAVILILGVFTFFSKLPQFFFYWLYRRLEAERFGRIMIRIRRLLIRLMLIAIPVFLLVVGLWAIRQGFERL